MMGYVAALDGLRGLAVGLVLAVHLVCGAAGLESEFAGHLLFKICYAGWSGVTLFFVLSGYLITGILYDSKRTPNHVISFYGKRTLRVFPLYYFALASGS